MEYVDSSRNCGQPAFDENTLNKNKDANNGPINENNIQCTFFREPKSKHMKNNNCIAEPSRKHSILFNLSDSCSDSESESDEPENEKPCPKTLSSNCNTLPSVDDKMSRAVGKAANAPKVRFDPKLNIHTDRARKFCRRRKRCAKLFKGPFAREFKDRTATESKVLSEQRKMCTKNVPRVAKKSVERTRSATNDEATWKMEKSIENRVFRNKCLLKTVKNVIRTVRRQESLFGANWISVDCIKPQNKIAETNLVKQSPKKVWKVRVTKESGTLKPMFKRAEVETLLNESMHEAVKKYRMCSGTWENIIKANSLKTC